MDTTGWHVDPAADDPRAGELAEAALARLRGGETVDLSAVCRTRPDLLAAVRSRVAAAAEREGFRDRLLDDRAAAPPWADHPPAGFHVVREIARGGMGVLYEARQRRLNRVVALKMMLDADAGGILRFLAEAEAVAAVDHPNVVKVYESGQHDGRPYLAMEFCPGGTLADRLAGRPAAPREAVELVAAVAAGVAAAHAEGVVHRDLKPGNVLFDAAGVPKVADFGLAKRGAGGDLTHTLAVLGTPAYMAPEQARGETKFVGPPADVWALGVILYEALAGRRAFAGDDLMAVLERVRSGSVVEVRAVRPEVPREVGMVVRKCLAADPRERYPSAHELAEDLGNWLAGRPVRAKPVGVLAQAVKWARRNPSGAAVAGMAVLLLAAAAVAPAVVGRRVEAARVEGLADRLRTASPGEMDALRGDLLARRGLSEPPARRLLAEARAAGDRRAELNAALVVAAWDEREVGFLLDRALAATPDEVLAVRAAVADRPAAVWERLRPVIADRDRPNAERLRALAVLAADVADAPADAVDEVATQLLVEDRLHLPAWIRALEPVKGRLVAPLAARYAGDPDGTVGVGAAVVLREYLRGDGQRAVPLIGRGGPRQAFVLGGALRDDPAGIAALLAEWERFDPAMPPSPFPTNSEEGGNAEATRRTKYGLALLAAGRPGPVWEAFKPSDEPQLRTDLIHAFAPAGLPPQALEGALAPAADPAVRQAVYLAWGEYPPDRWGAAEFDRVVDGMADAFATHPDAGVHSAAEWLLRKWGKGDRLAAARKELPTAETRGGRNWFVGGRGTTFAVVPGPVTARVGSFVSEWGQEPKPEYGPEAVHPRRVGRTFALATTEVTVAQFRAFVKDRPNALPKEYPFQGWANRTDDCPAGEFDWYTAARYCRWLGEKEGLKEADQPYPELGKIGPGMTLPADFLDRPGYRLPTEAEWEYACRGGARTPYGFGSDLESVSAHAWWVRNANNQTHPVGLLKPNPLGLFDTHGNAFEWCGHRAVAYPPVGRLAPVLDDAADADPCQPDDRCVLRGGDFPTGEGRLRAAHRTRVARTAKWPASGLRVCRTVGVPPLDVYRVSATADRATYAVRGPAGRFTVAADRASKVVAEGTIPGTFEVAAAPGGGRYAVTVARAGTGERRTVTDEFTPAEWTLRWCEWERDARDPLNGVGRAAWEKAVAAPPRHTATAPSPAYTWTDKPPADGVAATFNGFAATATVAVAGGTYRLSGVNSAGGYRVRVGGEVVLSQGWPERVNRESAALRLPAGRHEVVVEAYHLFGPAAFDLDLRPEP